MNSKGIYISISIMPMRMRMLCSRSQGVTETSCNAAR